MWGALLALEDLVDEATCLTRDQTSVFGPPVEYRSRMRLFQLAQRLRCGFREAAGQLGERFEVLIGILGWVPAAQQFTDFSFLVLAQQAEDYLRLRLRILIGTKRNSHAGRYDL